MTQMKNIAMAGLFITLVISCVEPFSVRSISFDKVIVVEGRLTNKPKAHYVKLSYTRPIGEQESAPLTGATVWVEGDDGRKIAFTEKGPGHYECSEGIAGKVGVSYQLFFTTSEDKQYQSNRQELIASPPIDSIYDKYAEKAGSSAGEIKKGIQFFIDTHDETNTARYYKYEWEETYEVYAQFPSYYVYVAGTDTVVARTEEVSPCYPSASSTAVTLGTTATLTENRLSQVPVRYITSETDRLKNVYSILVRQFVISAVAYNFYNDVLKNNTDNGSLFEKQPGTVEGNITSVEDPEEIVLGFFEVSGVSEKRAFFKFEDLDKRFPWPEEQYPCSPPHRISTTDSLEYYVKGKGYGIIGAEYNNGAFKASLAPRYCTDCRFRGPSTKPYFWIY